MYARTAKPMEMATSMRTSMLMKTTSGQFSEWFRRRYLLSRQPALRISDQLLDIPLIDLPAHVRRQFEFVERADGFAHQIFAALGVKRKVAGKQDVIPAEVIGAEPRRRSRARQRGVGMEHAEIILRLFLQWPRQQMCVRGRRA